MFRTVVDVAAAIWLAFTRGGTVLVIGGYKVVTLCGSTRFKGEFLEAQKRLTLEGNIVISVGLFGHSGDDEVWDGMDEGALSKTKVMLDDMHKRKIDMSDEIFVIDVDGYVGDSTRSEIEYAEVMGKEVRYLSKLLTHQYLSRHDGNDDAINTGRVMLLKIL